MGKWTKWTPDLVAQLLKKAHRRWLEDDIRGRKAGQPFNPAYLIRIKQRQVYGQNRRNGVFAAGLALVDAPVRTAWTARPHTVWTEKKVAARLQELFKQWWDGERMADGGQRWSLSYLTTVDKTFVRVTLRLGFPVERIVMTRIGGDIRTSWRPTRRIVRRPRQKRTAPQAAATLTELHRRWVKDEEHGMPAGRAFGGHYLRLSGEERLAAWLRRGKQKRLRSVMAYVSSEVRAAWLRKRTP